MGSHINIIHRGKIFVLLLTSELCLRVNCLFLKVIAERLRKALKMWRAFLLCSSPLIFPPVSPCFSTYCHLIHHCSALPYALLHPLAACLYLFSLHFLLPSSLLTLLNCLCLFLPLPSFSAPLPCRRSLSSLTCATSSRSFMTLNSGTRWRKRLRRTNSVNRRFTR